MPLTRETPLTDLPGSAGINRRRSVHNRAGGVMMNNNHKRSWTEKLGDFISGKGFYLVVLICVAAIALSGYYLRTGWRGGVPGGRGRSTGACGRLTGTSLGLNFTRTA